jgi:hypothetical protein
MSSIESNLSKQALRETKNYFPSVMTREALAQAAPTLNKLIYGDFVDIPLNQLPVAMEKEVLNRWYVKYIPKSIMRLLTGVKGASSIFPSRNLDSRRSFAFTDDASKKINEFINENFKPQLENLSDLEQQFVKSRLPSGKASTAVSQTVSQAAMQEKVEMIFMPILLRSPKVSTFMSSLLRSPKDIELKVIQDAQNKLHLLRPENWKELPDSRAYKEAVKSLKPERGKLLKETKQAIQQLKLNEITDANANAELTKLALNSIKSGQTDTLQLLKEGGADRVQIGRELASCKSGFLLPPA